MPSFDEPFDSDYSRHTQEWRSCVAEKVEVKGSTRQWSREEWKALCTLAGLPTEILMLVCSYLVKKADLANLARTNPKFYKIAIPLLYRKFHLLLREHSDQTLEQMLDPENPGLRYIREITVSPSFYDQNQSCAYTNLHALLIHVPRDKLKHFRWASPRALPYRILCLLWQRQPQLQNLELVGDHVDRQQGYRGVNDLRDELKRGGMQQLTELRVVPDTTTVAWLAGFVLKSSRIVSLEVDGRVWDNGDPEVDEDGEINDLLTETLFADLPPAPPGAVGAFNSLTSFKLSDINLRFVKRTWLRYVNLGALKTLELRYCAGLDNLLGILGGTATSPRLTSLTLLHSVDENGDRVVDHLEDMLTLTMYCLKNIELCIRNAPRLPRIAAFTSHYNTLERLVIDITGHAQSQARRGASGQKLVYNTDHLRDLFAQCSSVTQLGLYLPTPPVQYISYSRHTDDFTLGLDAIIEGIPDLRTLAILSWPADYTSNTDASCLAAKLPQLQRLAADIFARFRHYDPSTKGFGKPDLGTMLEVVAFGVRSNSFNEPPPKYFVESQVTVHGQTHLAAENRTLRELVEQDFEIDVLRYPKRMFDEDSRRTNEPQRSYTEDDDDYVRQGGYGQEDDAW